MKYQKFVFRSISFILLLATVLFTFGMRANAAATTFSVNVITDEVDATPGDGVCETSNAGECTLRAAIEEANANTGADTIQFTIGAGISTITPATGLPTITEQVTIDGIANNPGGATCGSTSTARNLRVVLDGASTSAVSGFSIGNGVTDTTIRGIAIGNFEESGVTDSSDGGTQIVCSHVGVNAAGDTAMPNVVGIQVQSDAVEVTVGGSTNTNPNGSCRGDCNVISGNTSFQVAVDSQDNVILGNHICINAAGTSSFPSGTNAGEPGIVLRGNGGNIVGNSSPQGRNIISGCDDGGLLSGSEGLGIESDDNTVSGNYVGLSSNGQQKVGNTGVGIALSTTGGAPSVSGNVIGGTDDNDRNVTSGNGTANIGIIDMSGAAQQNQIIGNYIGTQADGEEFLDVPSSSGIIMVGQPTNNIIGGTTAAEANVISGNTTGVMLFSSSGNNIVGLRNSIIGNAISNSSSGLGINIIDDATGDFAPETDLGVNANDVGDEDEGGNNYINYPEITDITTSGDDITFTYDLDINDSEAGVTGYRVEFFANTTESSSGNGEGEILLGVDNVAGDVNGGTVTFSNTGLSNGTYYFAATTTEVDASSDGFGSTSEFSVLGAQTVADADSGGDSSGGGAGQQGTQDSSNPLSTTGQSVALLQGIALVALCVAVGKIVRDKLFANRKFKSFK